MRKNEKGLDNEVTYKHLCLFSINSIVKGFKGVLKNKIQQYIRYELKKNLKTLILYLIGIVFFVVILQIVSQFLTIPTIPIDIINAFITVSSIILGFSFIVLSTLVRNGQKFNPEFVNLFVDMTKQFIYVLVVSLMILFARSFPWPLNISIIGYTITLESDISLIFLFLFVITYLFTGFIYLIRILGKIKEWYGMEENN